MKKRILAIVMALAMTIGLLPETNYAQEVNSAVATETGAETTTENTTENTAEKTTEIAEEATETTEIATEADTEDTTDKTANTYKTGLVQLQPKQIEITDADTDACGAVDSTGVRPVDLYWDRFESNYYYNQMSDAQKAFYDNLDALCYAYLTTQQDIYVKTSKLGITYSWIEDYGALDADTAKNVFEIFRYANPQYYFLGCAYGPIDDSKMFVFQIYNNFVSGTARSIATNNLKSTVDGMVATIQTQSDKLAMEKKAHDLITDKVAYDSDYTASANAYVDDEDGFNNWFVPYEENHYTQSSYSVFCGTDQTTVCAGYSLAFEMLCNAAGIDSISVLSLTHAFNMVRQNGSWYYVDCTWDDGSTVSYDYFNRTKDKLLNELDYDSAHVAETYLDSYIPNTNSLFDSKGSYAAIAAALGTADAPVMSTVVDGSGVNLTINSSQSGAKIYYTLDGTNPAVSATKCYNYSSPVTISASAIVKAIAVCDAYNDSNIVGEEIYTVTFNSVGGTAVAPQSVALGGLVTEPAKPTRSGYKFMGWYKEPTFNNLWNFSSDPVTVDTTLYAKWSKYFKITYKLYGGTQNASNPSKYTAGSATITLLSPSRKGYAFGGWYKDSGLKTKVTKIKSGSTVNLTLHAKWTKVNVAQGTISSLKNKSGKKMAVAVAKVSGAKGYQIRYSTKSSMKSAKAVKLTSTSTSVTSLTKNKTYYVQVRAYKLDSAGNKIYGSWSSIKSVKIKK